MGGGTMSFKLVDDDGIEVTIPAEPQRIVTFAPSMTEIVYALGLGDRLVGVSGSYDDYPVEAQQVEQVGGAASQVVIQAMAVVEAFEGLIEDIFGARLAHPAIGEIDPGRSGRESKEEQEGRQDQKLLSEDGEGHAAQHRQHPAEAGRMGGRRPAPELLAVENDLHRVQFTSCMRRKIGARAP